jgi:hypothetical protein
LIVAALEQLLRDGKNRRLLRQAVTAADLITVGKPTMAGRFRELFSTGKLTDRQIFTIVKREFKLPEARRYYVGWYRAYLTRRGEL